MSKQLSLCWICLEPDSSPGLVAVLMEQASFQLPWVAELCEHHTTEVSAELFKRDSWGHASEYAAHLLRRDS